ncbi:hypothetical protein L7F22_069205 [Adiantum nelumboides]|nr:hypothetical protein [Adiantum nelumboides]
MKRLLDIVNMPHVVWFNEDPVQKEHLTKIFSKYIEDAGYFWGEVAEYVKLELVPEQNEGPVKVVVQETMEAMVLQLEKNVLLEL